jgi:hypothetical protein
MALPDLGLIESTRWNTRGTVPREDPRDGQPREIRNPSRRVEVVRAFEPFDWAPRPGEVNTEVAASRGLADTCEELVKSHTATLGAR